jgi:toxin ParE1/3/4
MLAIIRSAKSENDLIAIWRYIAADNPSAATRLLQRIDRRIQSLGKYPLLGELQPELGSKRGVSSRETI